MLVGELAPHAKGIAAWNKVGCCTSGQEGRKWSDPVAGRACDAAEKGRMRSAQMPCHRAAQLSVGFIIATSLNACTAHGRHVTGVACPAHDIGRRERAHPSKLEEVHSCTMSRSPIMFKHRTLSFPSR